MTDEISFPPLFDVPRRQLAAQKQHLLSEIRRELVERRRYSLPTISPPRLRFVAPTVAAVCVATVCAVVFTGALGGSHHPIYNEKVGSSYGRGGAGDLPVPLPTLAQPLAPWEKQTTLSDATAMLGTPIVLPNTSLIQPSDAGPVWVVSQNGKEGNWVLATVAVTFPSQGVIIEYTRPAPSDGSAAHFQAMANSMPSPGGGSEGSVITLSGGVPALAVQQNSDDTGHNFGSVIFNMAGSEVRVIGHNDEATLESLAQSILSQSGASK